MNASRSIAVRRGQRGQASFLSCLRPFTVCETSSRNGTVTTYTGNIVACWLAVVNRAVFLLQTTALVGASGVRAPTPELCEQTREESGWKRRATCFMLYGALTERVGANHWPKQFGREGES